MIELVTEPRVSLVALALRVSWVLALGVLASSLARRRFPAMAHALGLVSLLVGMAAPLLWLGLPSWSVVGRDAEIALGAPAIADGPASVAPAPAPQRSAPARPTGRAASADTPDTTGLAILAGIVWLAGVAVGLASLGRALHRTRRLCARAEPAPRRLAELARHATASLGRRRPSVALGLCEGVRVPQLCGCWRPTILLPPMAAAWSDQRLSVVLRHELAHAIRFDLPALLLARLARILLWPQPLAWWLERGVASDCELATDQLALADGFSRAGYARELLAIALLSSGRPAVGVAATSGLAPLQDRIRRLLAPGRPAPAGLIPAASTSLSLLGVLLLSFGHPAGARGPAEAPWRLVGEDLVANRHTSLPLQRLQVVAFYDGAASPTTTLAFELAGGEPRRVEWITLQGLRKFVDRIETREYQLAPGWSPTGRATIRGVVPDGVLDGVAYGLSWRDDAGAFHVIRSRDAQGSPSPNSVCAWPLALPQDKLEARTPQITDSFGRDAARLAICGAQVLPDGVYAN